jgi:hypothetical protein
MAWPTLIELYQSQASHAYDGSEIRETWYVEPYSSVTAFIASCLGRVDADGVNPVRTLPAAHFLFPWCLAVKCDTTPLDPRQFSYMATTKLEPAANNRSDQMERVREAVGSISGEHLNPTWNIDDAGFRSQDNKDFSAGAFVTVTYLPVLRPTDPEAALQPGDMDFVDYRYETQTRTNVPNSGLKLMVPPMEVNFNGRWNMFYPAAGIAPIFKEAYQRLTIERRMLLPTFDLSWLSGYQNHVNNDILTLPPSDNPPEQSAKLIIHGQCLRFDSYDTQFVQVPSVDNNGIPNGFNRWLNLSLYYDWRTTYSRGVHDQSGNGGNTVEPVTWNHVLAYPGFLTWLNGFVNNVPTGLGWYFCKYSAAALGVDSDPYPICGGPGNTVPNATNIFDPCLQNH